jgi:TPR repeat protein
MLGIFVWWITHISSNNIDKTVVVPIEETFEVCQEMMKSDNVDTFMTGYQMMDSLSRLKYVPAMYELAFTLGWYSDIESIRRKDILGIQYERRNNNKRFMPKDDDVNQKAIYLMQNMLNIKDSNFAAINAESAYRLAGYYTNGTFLKQNYKLALDYLNEAHNWAVLSGDSILLTRVDNAKKNFN